MSNNINLLFESDQQMGNLCQAHIDDPTVYNSGDRPISSTMSMSLFYLDSSQNERIN